MSEHDADAVERVARALCTCDYKRRLTLPEDERLAYIEAQWPKYISRAEAAMGALKAGDHLTDSGDLRVIGWRETTSAPFVFDDSDEYS